MKKTYKREAGAASLGTLFSIAIYGVWADSQTAVQMVQALVIPVFGFIGAMMGLDSYAKQIIPASKQSDDAWPDDVQQGYVPAGDIHVQD